MTTKTNITLLPCPCCCAPAKLSDDYENGDGEPAVECSACCLLSWTVEDWNRRDHIGDATEMVPSDEQAAFQSWAEIEYRNEDTYSARDYRMGLDAWKQRARYSSGQPAASAEPLVRFCPGCGSIGPVPEQYRNCCPDGIDARMIPQALAEKCRDTFQVAVKVLTAEAEAKLHAQSAAPVAQEPVARVNDEGFIVETGIPLAPGTKLYTSAPVAAQTQPLLYQHDDGRYGLSFGPARFAAGDPAWHRVPIDVIDAALPSDQDREDAPSIWNPLTTYGVLVQALRIVAGTTLMEMSEGTGYTPSYLSSVEVGREVPTDGVIGTTHGFFCDKGIDVPLSLLQAASAAKGADHA